jgi:hypothetical protein
MRKEYDFSKSVKNPYAKHLKKQVTLRLGIDVIIILRNWLKKPGFPIRILSTYTYKIVLILKKN